jgi:hypothetical protein
VSQPVGADVHVVLALQAAAGHAVFLPQLFWVEQVTSHLQEAAHSTPLAQPPAEQSTLQEPGPQVTPELHALFPQMATQSEEEPQFTFPPHAPLWQVTAHGPVPHVSPFVQAFTPQSTEHVADLEQSMEEPQVPSPHSM